MNKKILCVVPMCVALAACAAPRTNGCVSMSVPDVCTSSNQTVTINVASGLTVAPPNVCAQRGSDVTFRVTPNNTDVTVTTIPKDAADTWLVGINSPDANEFTISIPGNVAVRSDHDYYIVSTNGYCYDPRIHIDPDR